MLHQNMTVGVKSHSKKGFYQNDAGVIGNSVSPSLMCFKAKAVLSTALELFRVIV